MKKKVIIAIALVLVCVAVIGWLNRPMQADAPSAWLLQAAEGLDEIAIEADLDAENRTLSVKQALRLQNRTGVVTDIVENVRGFYVTVAFEEPEVEE